MSKLSSNQIGYQPFLIIISSPSGAGKSTICRMIVKDDPKIKLSISATTRPKRESETEGKDYFFVSKERFFEMANSNQFLEYAEVFGNNYGTPRFMVEDELKNQNCILFDIDWQGARQIRQNFPAQEILSIFILPPSRTELEKRLKNRAQDAPEVVLNRMNNVGKEVSHYQEYDFVIINEDIDSCYQNILSIITSKKLVRQNQSEIANLAKELSLIGEL